MTATQETSDLTDDLEDDLEDEFEMEAVTPPALLFPGQGSQEVGMARAWVERFDAARRTFEEADDVLGYSLSKLCFEGPEDELNLTANTQPALLTASVAIHRAMNPWWMPTAVAGHSLGEYSALVAAGSLGFADALRLVRRRGELMQEAVPPGVGAMAAVMMIEAPAVEEVAARAARDTGKVCSVANYNSPLQTVLAGHAEAVERAVELAKEAGARKVSLLPVSAPFHCELMAPVTEAMAELLAEVELKDPKVGVIANVTAEPVYDGATARDLLVRQIEAPVRWTETLELLGTWSLMGLVEVGPGKVLSGLARRTVKHLTAVSLQHPDALADVEKLFDLDNL
jgi:[acyl-carrier-protein] S-malonyltransferase